MSHITKIQTKIYNISSLAEAAEQLGLEFIENRRTFRCFGWGDTSCDHVLKVSGNSTAYEVGLKLSHDGSYELKFYDFDGGYGLMKKIGAAAGLLLQRYAVVEATRLARIQGYSVTESLCEDGSVELEILTEAL
jgi:hypothetical protein